jgi:hypothetical protein
MTITQDFLKRWCRIPATLTTVTAGERDDMNHPAEVTATESVLVWVHPEMSSEDTGTRPVATTRFVGYLLPCTEPTGTSRLTIGTAEYEFDGPPKEWTHPMTTRRIGWEAALVRTS